MVHTLQGLSLSGVLLVFANDPSLLANARDTPDSLDLKRFCRLMF